MAGGGVGRGRPVRDSKSLAKGERIEGERVSEKIGDGGRVTATIGGGVGTGVGTGVGAGAIGGITMTGETTAGGCPVKFTNN